jgi:PIN domain nuclease of toxin-antitoxin system
MGKRQFMMHLDSHVVKRLYEGLLDKLPAFAKKQLEDHELMISPMVQLELEYLFEIKRIKQRSYVIINELMKTLALQILDIPLEKIILEAIKLSWTRDPFDRIIVASAQINNALLLTKNTHIAKHYRHTIWD